MIAAQKEEHKCEVCGNWTECNQVLHAGYKGSHSYVCDICLPTLELTPDQVVGNIQPYEPTMKDKIYNLAVPNLASDTQHEIAKECIQIARTLLEKNRKYGDSVFRPARIFSKSDPIEQINIRIDDKLSRLLSGQADEDEDVDLDLIGYLIIRRIAKRTEK